MLIVAGPLEEEEGLVQDFGEEDFHSGPTGVRPVEVEDGPLEPVPGLGQET